MPKTKKIFAFTFLLLVPVSFSFAQYQKPGPVRLDRSGERWAETTLSNLTVEQKIGQLIMVRGLMEFVNVDSPAFVDLRDSIRRYHLGSVLLTVRVDDGFLMRNEPYEAAMFTNLLQRDSEIPLIFAADFERGLFMRLYGTTIFPHAMAFGAAGKTSYAESFGRIVGEESRAIGVQWNFFPVMDVNSNPANPIINTRSFGEDPAQVAALGDAYIDGSRQSGMLSTAKHFPGHGDTDTDSHLALARVGGDINRLQSIELVPFERAIAAGVDAVMTAHVTVPALDADPNRVATNSEKIVTGLLKEKLGFKGLVVTDAMEMRGLTRLYPPGASASGRAAVDAFNAGNDMILLPSDLDGAYKGLLQAARNGEISSAQIDASVLKVLRAKAAVGLHRAKLVDLNEIANAVLKPENVAVAQEIADAAVTLVRDNGRALPLKRGTSKAHGPYEPDVETANRVVALIFTDDTRSEAGRGLEHGLRARIPDANIIFLDDRNAQAMAAEVISAVKQASTVVAATYVVPTAGKMQRAQGALANTVSLADSPTALMNQVLQVAAEKTVVVAMGNPYVAMSFPGVQTYLCTFSTGPTSEVSAVKALFAEMPIRGHMPVTLPGIAARGVGMEKAASPIALQSARNHARRRQARLRLASRKVSRSKRRKSITMAYLTRPRRSL